MKPKHTLKHWLIAGALAAMPWAAHAAGLGDITVVSALGQPLRAEIDLIAVPKDEVDLLVAKLASPDEYRRAGLERPEAAGALRLAVEKRANGQPYLKVTSLQPVNEPFLQLLVQLDWPGGRVFRGYTVLLDPPGLMERPAVAQLTPPKAEPEVAKAAPAAPAAKTEPEVAKAAKSSPRKAAREPAAEKPPVLVRAQPTPALTPAEQTFPRFDDKGEAQAAMPTAPAPATSAVATPAATTYRTKPGDTLAKVARQFKPEGFSLEQMLVALFEANRDAFAGANMNRLKAGQILRVPEAAELARVDRSTAVKEVKAHAADWNAYRQKLAAAGAEPAQGSSAQEASGRITAKVEEKTPEAPAPTKDVLKLSRGESAQANTGAAAAGSKAGAADVKALQEKLNAAQEEAAAKEKALAEANSRIAELEKNIADMKRLIEAQNQRMAELQKQASAPAAAAPAKPEAAEKPAPAESAPKPQEATPAPAAAPAEPKPEAAPKPVAKKPAPKVIQPVPEPSLMEELLSNPVYLAGGGAVAIGGLLAALWAVGRRRRKSLASFEDSLMTGGDLKANTVFGNTGGGQIDTGDTSFLTDFSQGGMGAIDTHEVDPIAEAEVYMAYGRDAQAEEILKEALSKDPSRHEVQLKLLEIYADRRNKEDFETVAAELYAATGGQGPVWEKAAELGRGLDPDNPLYAGGRSTAPQPAAAAASAAAAGVAAAGVAAAGVAAAAESAAREATNPPTVDFTLDLDTAGGVALDQATVPANFSTEEPLDFDLDVSPAQAESAPAAEVEPASLGEAAKPAEEATLEMELDTIIPKAVEKQAESGGEFSLELPELAPPESAAGETEQAQPGEAAPTLDFDFEFETPTSESAPGEATAEPTTEALLPNMDLSDLEFEMPKDLTRELAQEEPTPSATPLVELGTVAGTPGEWEEISTKLDLARAYVEMGDKEGAREILEEVIQEGGPEQQADAKKLLASLA